MNILNAKEELVKIEVKATDAYEMISEGAIVTITEESEIELRDWSYVNREGEKKEGKYATIKSKEGILVTANQLTKFAGSLGEKNSYYKALDEKNPTNVVELVEFLHAFGPIVLEKHKATPGRDDSNNNFYRFAEVVLDKEEDTEL